MNVSGSIGNVMMFVKRLTAPLHAGFKAGSGSTAQASTRFQTASRLAEEDLDFLLDAAQAGMAEAQAATIASSRAWDAKTKAFANKMSMENLDSNERLAALARAKGVVLPMQLDIAHQRLQNALQQVDSKQLDVSYALETIKSHKLSIAIFAATAKHSRDADIRHFAARMLPRLQRHLASADQLLNAVTRTQSLSQPQT